MSGEVGKNLNFACWESPTFLALFLPCYLVAIVFVSAYEIVSGAISREKRPDSGLYIFRITEIRRVFSKKTIAIQFYLDTTIVFFVRTDSEAITQGRRDKVARAIKTRLSESSVF